MNLSVYELRKRHPRFIYHSYQFEIEKEVLRLSFHFEIEPNISFFPQVKVKGIKKEQIDTIGIRTLNNFIFHLGLMEIPSYWKATCSPEILIKAGSLDNYQQNWWKDLLIKGLGEFFYVNNIDFTGRDFVTVNPKKAQLEEKFLFAPKLNADKFLIPIGGGKDSAVGLKVLSKSNKEVVPFCLNPTAAALHMIKLHNLKVVTAERNIDIRLLNLNKEGYLNGHTPFSAYLAFLSTFIGVLFGIRTVLICNGRSSNEPNVMFSQEEINHQYSKSFRFEQRFREYSKKYLTTQTEFISFLRPLYELQIAKIFSSYPKYFSVFKSCNKNQKSNSWCHNCAKCLFVYTILYPFIDKKILTTQIFSGDLFERKELIHLVKKFLVGSDIKPFDCVGTRQETMVAFQMCLEKAKKDNGRVPFLLKAIVDNNLIRFPNLEKSKKEVLSGWDRDNFLTRDLKMLLKKTVGL